MVHTKTNGTRFADALLREAEGLELLRNAIETAGVIGVNVPTVYSVNEDRLEMTRVNPSRQSDAALQKLGQGLARVHGLPQAQFGFHHDNYIGLNPQRNIKSQSWGNFYVRHRLGYQVGLIKDRRIRVGFEEILDEKGETLAAWLNEYCAGPSLLHGDLWSGNVLFDDHSAWLIDPAVYYGDSEADLAMTEMFGGFGPAFYKAYDEVRPRSEVYPRKREIYNLYHFLNHYNLFGNWYLGPCEKGFRLLILHF